MPQNLQRTGVYLRCAVLARAVDFSFGVRLVKVERVLVRTRSVVWEGLGEIFLDCTHMEMLARFSSVGLWRSML